MIFWFLTVNTIWRIVENIFWLLRMFSPKTFWIKGHLFYFYFKLLLVLSAFVFLRHQMEAHLFWFHTHITYTFALNSFRNKNTIELWICEHTPITTHCPYRRPMSLENNKYQTDFWKYDRTIYLLMWHIYIVTFCLRFMRWASESDRTWPNHPLGRQRDAPSLVLR